MGVSNKLYKLTAQYPLILCTFRYINKMLQSYNSKCALMLCDNFICIVCMIGKLKIFSSSLIGHCKKCNVFVNHR